MKAEFGRRKAEFALVSRLPRFSLRTLLAVVTIICIALGAGVFWYRAQETEYRRQLQVCERLKEFGEVQWGPRTPAWLKWLGDSKAFERITRVDCHGSAVASEVLNVVEKLPTIESIELCDNQQQFTDEVVERIARLKQLKQLRIKHYVHTWGSGTVPETAEERFRAADARYRAAQELTKRLQRRLPQVQVRLVEWELL